MVNEVVMYQSMFLLGVIMFGFFATSFNNYTNFAETVTLDNNLERVLQEVGEEILILLDEASDLRGQSTNLTIEVRLSLDAEYATESYIISADSSLSNNVTLIAEVRNEEIARLPLSIPTSQINFTGQLVSSSIDTKMTYIYSSTPSPTESIIFSS